jgi:hypothetical protein
MRLTLPLLALVCATSIACSESDPTAFSSSFDTATPAPDDDLPAPDAFENHRVVGHFRISWNSADASEAEVKAVADRMDPLWTKLSAWVGPEHLAAAQVEVQLEGDGMKPNQPPNFPHVGQHGRVHLFRYPGGESGAYERQLEHETIHATRELMGIQEAHAADYATGYGFVEEGFAEMLAREITPEQSGFPVFGQTFDVAVGALFAANDAIPLTTLMHHHDINVHCMRQAYPLRASFMKYLLEEFGREKVLELAYPAGAVNDALYSTVFGKTPDELAKAWEPWARARFAALPDAQASAAAYNASAIQYFPKCVAGTDF